MRFWSIWRQANINVHFIDKHMSWIKIEHIADVIKHWINSMVSLNQELTDLKWGAGAINKWSTTI